MKNSCAVILFNASRQPVAYKLQDVVTGNYDDA